MIPLLLLAVVSIGSFYYYDPFQVLKNQEAFNESMVGYNEGFVATERYLKSPSKYDSFIFGSSRSGCGFRLDDWAASLRKKDGLFLFAASNETIFGILGKIKLIDEVGGRLDNALIIIDTDKTFKTYENSKGHLFIKHYRVSKTPKSVFITAFLKDYIFSGFFIRYLDFKLFKTQRPYMKDFLDFSKLHSTKKHQLFNVSDRMNEIKKDSITYYKAHKSLFSARSEKPITKKPMISERGIAYLHEIKSIFDRHHTAYEWVIGPLYNQEKMNPKDLQILKDIFGASHIHDYSGQNKFTKDFHNYFEPSHYRPRVGAEIMSRVY